MAQRPTQQMLDEAEKKRAKLLQKFADAAMQRCHAHKLEIVYTGVRWFVSAVPMTPIAQKLAMPEIAKGGVTPDRLTELLDKQRSARSSADTLEKALIALSMDEETRRLIES